MQLLLGASGEYDKHRIRRASISSSIGVVRCTCPLTTAMMPFYILFQDYVRVRSTCPKRGDPGTSRKLFPFTSFWYLRSFPLGQFLLHDKGSGAEIDVRIEHL